MMRRFEKAIVVGSTILCSLNSGRLFAQAPTRNYEIAITGPEETVIPRGMWGMYFFPDEAISFRRDAGGIRMWFTVSGSTVELTGPTFSALTPPQLDSHGSAVPVFNPSGLSDLDSNYAGAGSIIPAANGKDLLMFYHGENHACTSVSAGRQTVGLAKSTDNGATWTRIGPIISSEYAFTNGCGITPGEGVGTPGAAISPDGQYIYLYFTRQQPYTVQGPVQTYMARSPIASDGAPGSWTKYNNGSFSTPGFGGASTPVIAPGANPSANYAFNPNVSFNTYLKKYLAAVQGQDGTYITTSADGVTWDPSWQLTTLPSINSPTLTAGADFWHYPTLLSLDQPSQMTTSQTGYLYMARGQYPLNFPTQTHFMVRRPFIIATGALAFSAAKSSVADSAVFGALAARSDTLTVNLLGVGMTNAKWTATHGSAPWLSLSTTSSSGPITVLGWTLNTSSLKPGVYVDTISMTSPSLANAPFKIVETVTVYEPTVDASCAARDLLGQSCLTADLRQYLDASGNADHSYNLGDLLSYLDRKGLHLSASVMSAVLKNGKSAGIPTTTKKP